MSTTPRLFDLQAAPVVRMLERPEFPVTNENPLPLVSLSVLESDSFLDRMLDVLEKRNGEPLNLARWDLKAAIQETLSACNSD